MATPTSITPPGGFTPAWIAAFTPPPGAERGGRVELADKACSGLSLRFAEGWAPSFRCKLTGAEGKRQNIVIGPWSMSGQLGHVTLAQARLVFFELRQAAKEGRLEEAVKRHKAVLAMRPEPATKRPSSAPAVPTVELVANQWYRLSITARRKKDRAVRRTLDNDLLPALGARPFAGVRSLELSAVIRGIVARGAVAYAGTALAHVKQLWRWAESEGFLDVDGAPLRNAAAPLSALELGVKENARDRVASDDEIRAIWLALEAPRAGLRGMDRVVSLALRFLLLTGARSGEACMAEWPEFDLEGAVWTVPADHQKKVRGVKPRPWKVPLSTHTVALLRELQVLTGKGRYVFASPGHTESKSGHVANGSLSRAMLLLFEPAAPGEKPLVDLGGAERITPHDLRRTLRTGLGLFRIDRDIKERCLNHKIPGVEGVYDRFDYLDERRAALEAWARHVHQVVNGPPPKGAVKLHAVK